MAGTAASALREGIRRVNGAPWVVAGTFLVTLLIALPLAIALGSMIEAHLGPSLAAEAAAAGTNYDWWQEFSAQATGLATTFVPSIVGFGAVLENLSNFLDDVPLATTVAGAVAAWLVIWSFLSGGVLDRLARARRTRAAGFFAACGTHFWRFLRLGALAWLVYVAAFEYVHRWIFADALGALTHETAVERTAFVWRLAGYAIFGMLLVGCNIIFDYARIRIVVEDRRSAVGALAAGARFAARHARGVSGLYALNALAFLGLVLAYAVAGPGAPRAGWPMWVAFGIGEAYILGRHYLKLLFYASETAYFQHALAHAAYTASPELLWPDSPAAEAIGRAQPALAKSDV